MKFIKTAGNSKFYRAKELIRGIHPTETEGWMNAVVGAVVS